MTNGEITRRYRDATGSNVADNTMTTCLKNLRDQKLIEGDLVLVGNRPQRANVITPAGVAHLKKLYKKVTAIIPDPALLEGLEGGEGDAIV